MRALLTAALLTLCAAPALLAETALPAPADSAPQGKPLTAAEFDAYVTGKTLTYSQYGQVFGIEEYLPGRRVRWATGPDECQYGKWYQKDAMICFAYEYGTREHCWRFWQSETGLSAVAEGAALDEALNEVQQSRDGLACPAPDVGV